MAADQQQTMRDFLAWCRKERDSALKQIDLFTTGGAKAFVQNGDAAPMDITPNVVAHGREVVEKMGHFLATQGAPQA
jgi:seryl-tRNA(Sec) selenium transferase